MLSYAYNWDQYNHATKGEVNMIRKIFHKKPYCKEIVAWIGCSS